MDNTLTYIANSLHLDKGTCAPSTGHHGPRLNFTTIYEQFFNDIRNENIKILEIGISNGNSLKMWKQFFNNGNIYGIDIVDCKQYDAENIKTFQGNQSNRNELKNIIEQIGEVDIIIDDGSHVVSHQQISFGFLFPYIKNNGMYWIEDLHTSDNIWQGKTLYGNNMSFNQGDSTVDFLERIQNNKFESNFLLKTELEYIKNNLLECKLFDLPYTSYGVNKLCLLKKK